MANLVESAWAFLIVMPFMLLLLAALRVCEQIDQEASRRHATDLRLARSRSLLEAETRFLGYMHDQVLHHLDGVRRGLIAPEPLPVRLPSMMLEVESSLRNRAERAVAELAATLRQQDPGLTVEQPKTFPLGGGIPTAALSLISDAALEALDNSMKHAAGSARRAVITVKTDGEGTCTGLDVKMIDEGPGFLIEEVPTARAGVRVSILCRMRSSPGLSARVDSRPGEGTSVHLRWRQPDSQNTGPVAVAPPPEIRNIFNPGRIYNPIFAVFAIVIACLMGLGHEHVGGWGQFIVAMVLLVLAMMGLMQGQESKLPLGTTFGVVALLACYLVVAAREPLGENALWPPIWYTLIFTFMCLLLAIRGRIVFAWVLILAGLLGVPWLEQDLSILEQLTYERVAGLLALMIPGTLAPLALDWILKSISSAMLEDSAKETNLVVAATRRSYITDSAAWLEQQLSTVLDPALSEPQRIFGANLLELKLRDAIRSPGFDEQESNREIWWARRRGVTVKLSDDRSDEHGVDPDPQPLAHAAMHRALKKALKKADIRVTARMLPAGRSTYATILQESWDEAEEVKVERIQITSVMSPADVEEWPGQPADRTVPDSVMMDGAGDWRKPPPSRA